MSEFDRQNKQYTREELIEQVNADAQVRAFELLETPSLVPGNFDANHLKAVHGFIFQDSSDLLPVGEYRERVPSDCFHYKAREIYPDGIEIYYANDPNDDKLNAILSDSIPKIQAAKNVDEFASDMADMYARLDYQHPFAEGNSRTLRTFTHMVAQDAGFELDWSNTGVDRFKRAELYVARDMHMIDANFDFSNEHLNKLAKTNLTEYEKHVEYMNAGTVGYLRQSQENFGFRPLNEIIKDSTKALNLELDLVNSNPQNNGQQLADFLNPDNSKILERVQRSLAKSRVAESEKDSTIESLTHALANNQARGIDVEHPVASKSYNGKLLAVDEVSIIQQTKLGRIVEHPIERVQGLQGNKLTDVIKISYDFNLKGKVTNENTQALSNEQTNDFGPSP